MKNPNLRFWDKTNKKMVKIEDLPAITLPEIFKNYEIMRSTGFKDKNNNEIFEGDILEIEIENTGRKRKLLCRIGKFKKKIIAIDKKRHTAEINGFYFLSDTFDTLLPTIKNKISDTEKMVVLGNMYETTELMVW